jgi:hypothetical protein
MGFFHDDFFMVYGDFMVSFGEFSRGFWMNLDDPLAPQ